MIWQRMGRTPEFGVGELLFRMKVPNGWLVKHIASIASSSICFVPDPEHRWAIDNNVEIKHD